MKRLALTSILILASVVVFAQNAITTSGSNASGAGGSVSYTIGQAAFLALKDADNSIIQGVQQPYEISVITGIDPPVPVNIVCQAYPNPVTETLWLNIESDYAGNFRYQLFDNLGKLLTDKIMDSRQATIPMQSYPPAIYFLKVSGILNGSSGELKTFKIVKH